MFKFTEEDLKILKSYSNFNSDTTSMQFKSNTNFLFIRSKDLSIMSSYNMGKSINQTFSIFDLKKFINSLNLFNDVPTIDINEKYCNIIYENTKIKYMFSSPMVVNKNIVADEKFISYLSNEKEMPFDISFMLQSKHIREIKKSQGILKLPDIGFFGDSGKLYLKSYDKASMNGDSYSIEIGETDKNFILVLSKTFKLIFEDDEYLVNVKSDSMLMKLASAKINYMVGLDMESKIY